MVCVNCFLYFVIEKDEECITNILKDVDKGVRSCECGVDCDETGYETKISSSIWPSPKYEVMIVNITSYCSFSNSLDITT